MAKGTLLKKEDVIEIKKWLAKGFSTGDIEEITKRSAKTIRKVRDGGFDYMLQESVPETAVKAPAQDLGSDGARLNRIVDQLDQMLGKLDTIIERMDTCEFLR